MYLYEASVIAGTAALFGGVLFGLRALTKPDGVVSPGSVDWLIAKERKYGGLITGVERRRVSPLDPRSTEQLKEGGMVGGDRMSSDAHNYAKHYAKHLRRYAGRSITCVEAGILRGTGLATWSDLFPDGRIIGLDIDLSHFRDNEPSLKKSGAFRRNNVEVHEFDQFTCTPETLEPILRGSKIDVYIDDGFHSDDSITISFKAVLPNLALQCVCFIEDNETVDLGDVAHGFSIERHGQLTILNR
jgi:hypothetical protein